MSLIRSLPKRLRKQFLPVADTARRVLQIPASGGLIDHLRRELTRISGESVLAEDFDLGRLAPHLKPTFRIVGPDGSEMGVGDDLDTLREELREVGRAVAEAGSHRLERTGITGWDFGELPRVVQVEGPSHRVDVYPALVDEGDSVAIRLMATVGEQREAMWSGTRRLLALGVTGASKLLQPLLSPQAKADLSLGPYPGSSEWMEDCVDCAVDGSLAEAGGPVWDGVAFDRLARRVRSVLGDALTAVGRGSLGVMAALRDVQIVVDRSQAPLFEDAVEDVRGQVTRLVYPGFLGAIGMDRIADVERYLRAVGWRLDRLADNPARDAEHLAVVRRLEVEYDRLVDSIPLSTELVAVGWMLQELRVSYFAQQLGTRETVSAKRVAAALREAELAS